MPLVNSCWTFSLFTLPSLVKEGMSRSRSTLFKSSMMSWSRFSKFSLRLAMFLFHSSAVLFGLFETSNGSYVLVAGLEIVQSTLGEFRNIDFILSCNLFLARTYVAWIILHPFGWFKWLGSLMLMYWILTSLGFKANWALLVAWSTSLLRTCKKSSEKQLPLNAMTGL